MQKSNPNKIKVAFIISHTTFVIFFTALFFSGAKQVNAIGLSDILSSSVTSTMTKMKNLFAVSAKQGSVSSIESVAESEDFVLKPNSKNRIEKNSTDTKVSVLSDGDVLSSAVGPLRSSTEEELIQNDTIAVYEVKEGDTLKDIAKLYDVSKNTIVWANDIKNEKLVVGDTLIILPVSGVSHKIKKGDTLASLAKKYKGDEKEIAEFNNIKNNDIIASLGIEEEIVIPDGEIYVDAPKKKSNSKDTIKKPKQKRIYASAGAGYYVRPIIGGIKTQGLHGNNAIDIGASVGSTILAAANGTVQVAKQGGYNGGYGSMIIISHPNGTQTLYAHMSQVYVSTGQSVVQGENIGTSGNSGKSTGPHLHFEIRGAANPF